MLSLAARPLSPAPTAWRAGLRSTHHWLQRVSFSRIATIVLACYLVLPTFVVLVFSFDSARTLGLPWHGFTTEWYPKWSHGQASAHHYGPAS